jgi:Ca2+-binding RTX toxin-like protein
LPDFITTSTYGGDNEGVQSLLSMDGTENYSHWEGEGKTNTPTDLTYSYQTIGTVILGNQGGSLAVTQNFNENAQVFLDKVFDNISSVANINFTESTSQADSSNGGADIRISQIASSQIGGLTSNTISYLDRSPNGENPKSIDATGNLFIVSDNFSSDSFTTDYNDENQGLSQAIANTLGLDRPFETSSSGISGFYAYDDTDSAHQAVNSNGQLTGGAHNSPDTDGMLETVMTAHNAYNPGSNDSSPWQMGIYDIAALQHLYGANYDTNAGDTIYAYDSDTPVFDTIWDGGGTDTIMHSGDNQALINLNEGQTSHLGMTPNWSIKLTPEDLGYSSGSVLQSATLDEASDGTLTISEDGSYVTFTSNLEAGGTDQQFIIHTQVTDPNQAGRTNPVDIGNAYFGDHNTTNVGIAFGVTIENGIGGNANDTIIGNSAHNMLTGNGGNDALTGAGGNDIFIYDNGSSSVSTNEFGNDAITDFTSGADVIHIQNEVGSENVSFSGGVLTLGTAGTITLTDVTSLTEGTDYIFV